jgi:hypothetical protein
MIRFWCECGRQLQADQEHVGQPAVCPLCERTTIVPATDQPRHAARVAASAAVGGGRYDLTPEAPPVAEAPEPEPSSGMATAAAVCGVLSFPLMLSVLTGVPAIVLGALALLDRRVREGEAPGKGKAVAGMMLGLAGLLLLVPAYLLYARSGEDGWFSGSAGRKADKEGAKKPPANLVNVGQNVWLEVASDRRRVLVSAEVCKREGELEHLLTRQGIKAHESILTANVDARKIHEALVIAEAKPGSIVRYAPEFRPPSGTRIRVLLRYEEDGKTKTVPARSWVRSLKTRQELPCDWVFAGSQVVEDRFNNGPPRYLANEGDLICIANMESALLDVPIESSKGNDDHSYAAWTERIPKEGTKVTVILEPVLK